VLTDICMQHYADREEWRSFAGPKAPDYSFGATACTAILGVSPYVGAWDIWAQAYAPHLLPKRVQTEDQTRGLWWESKIAAWYAEFHEMEIRTPLCRVWHKDAEWLRVSPDGFAVDPGTCETGMMEIKTQRHRKGWGKDESVVRPGDKTAGVIPPHIVVQVYAQLAASGLPWNDVIVCFDISDIRVIRVYADPARQAWLLKKVGAWRTKHLVEPFNMPDPGESAAFYEASKGVSREGSRDATEGEATLARHYQRAKLIIKQHEKLAKTSRNQIIHSMGEHKTITYPGGRASIDARGALRIK